MPTLPYAGVPASCACRNLGQLRPTGIGCGVVDAVRHGAAKFLDQEIIHADVFWLALRTPGPTSVLEVADKLFLLGIHRDHRLTGSQCGPHALVEVAELRIPIRVAFPLARLAIGLQTELLLVQQLAEQSAANPVALGDQRLRQLRQALHRPAQRRHRIAARIRLDQRQQIGNQRGILRHPLLAATTGTADPTQVKHLGIGQFLQPPANRAGRHAGGARYRRNATIPGRLGFCRREHAPGTLVQVLRKRRIAPANRGDVDHPYGVSNSAGQRNQSIATRSHSIRLSTEGP